MDHANPDEASSGFPNEPIAIIGTGCRFPGNANTPSKFWDLLCQPRDVLQSVAKRFSAEGWHHQDGKYHGHSNVTKAYLLEGDQHQRFDAQFFGINAVEAQTLDPQVRLLLETVYEALESAGLTLEGLRGSDTAVYTGMMSNTYKTFMERDLDSIGTYHVSGVSAAMMSNRLSYFFDWHGPSITIDTACSSSLIAVHQAVQQLRAGHSRIAVAAGSNLLLDPADYVGMSKLDMLSPTGRSRMWDKEANGYARGEGVAAVVLKTLSAAEADGDHIECVIRETATNQDGRTPGITMPSAAAQAQLIRDCYARAGLDPTDAKERPQYFEAHGTGTPAGDPIEAEAIRTAFFPPQALNHADEDPSVLFVGGVKTVIGHSESAAGLAGLIKASLALQHGIIPPNLLFSQINPRVEQSYCGCLRLPTELTPWPDHGQDPMGEEGKKRMLGSCRRASVNSFGFGGSNAHAILESYTPFLSTLHRIKSQESTSNCSNFTTPTSLQSAYSSLAFGPLSTHSSLPTDFLSFAIQDLSGHLPFVFSANSETALTTGLASMLNYLKNIPEGEKLNLRDLAMTLHSRRSRLPYCVAFSASTVADLCHKLDAELHGNQSRQQHTKSSSLPSSSPKNAKDHKSKAMGSKKRVLLIFTGQGAQCPRMGASLIEQSPVCAGIINRLESRLATLDPASDRPSWSLKEELLRHPNDQQERAERQPTVAKAAVSQPLCTALQILQVNILRQALGDDLEIAAAVGHSSGEIAAAYCAGVISAEDAICVAYYRGLAVSTYDSNGTAKSHVKGGMLAVGTSFQDAMSLCSEPEFAGHDASGRRLEVAAVNSPQSVTLSGDEDAIEEAAAIFEDEGKPVTRLRVDNRAYHSRRMVPCSVGYLAALQSLGIQVNCPTQDEDNTIQPCRWVSSVGAGAEVGNGLEMLVSGGDVTIGCTREVLGAQYWVDNMVKPVMFMPAVQRAWELHGPFDMAVEVGPHPALKRPTLDTIKAIGGVEIAPPYTGLQFRGQDAVESLSNALGCIWTYLGQGVAAASTASDPSNGGGPLNLSRFDKILRGDSSPAQKPQYNVVKGLPPYAWDHKDKIYWHESRFTKALRLRSDPVHELLGHLTPDSTSHDMRWRNILSPREVPWLSGHSLQHQVVFPAAGYVVSALDAALFMARRLLGNSRIKDVINSLKLIEVMDLDIHSALTFDSEDTRIETITALTDISHTTSDTVEANFKFNGTPTLSGTDLTLLAMGRIRITLGDCNNTSLPPRDNHPSRFVPDMSDIEADPFYTSLEKLDYQYSGAFRALSHLRRRLDFATGRIAWEASDTMLLHPGVLDSAFQSVFLALCAPNSGGIWAMHVPKSIRAVQINPHVCRTVQERAKVDSTSRVDVEFDCTMGSAPSAPNTSWHKQSPLTAHIEVFTTHSEGSAHASQATMVRVQGLELVPFSQPSPQDDTTMFSHVIWDVAAPNAELVTYDGHPTESYARFQSLLEHVAVSYLSRLQTSVPADHPARLPSSPYHLYFRFASHILSLASKGELNIFRATLDGAAPLDGLALSEADILAASEEYRETIDFRLLTAIGENIVDIATGKTPALDIAMRDGMLAEYYQKGTGLSQYTPYLARLVRQIIHRHGGSTFKILEVGAGTGSATRRVLEEIFSTYEVGFAEYTFTDISSGFFEAAKEALFGYKDSQRHESLKNLVFKVLDVTKDIRGQGFVEGTYDLVIASAVLHATPNLSETLTNVRRLLKPAGYLAVLELPDLNSVATPGTIFGSMPGWWLGADDGRTLSPCVGLAEWDRLLRSSGFSGCDTATQLPDGGTIIPTVVFVTQAVDDRVDFLREPLGMPSSSLFLGDNHGAEKLLLLGGNKFQTSKLAAQITRLLRGHWGDNIQTVRSISDVSSLELSHHTTVLSLLDVVSNSVPLATGSVLEHPTEETWTGLKTVLQQAGTVLWVSTGRRASNPHANMLVGLLRAAKVEIPTLDIQALDIDSDNTIHLDARDLAETLLRFKAATTWRRRGDHDSLLNAIEPELVQQSVYSANEPGRPIKTLLVPRVVANKAMNNRFNSSRRSIQLPMPSSLGTTDHEGISENYRLTWSPNREPGCAPRLVPISHDEVGTPHKVKQLVRTTYSFAAAVQVTESSSLHLVLGQDPDQDTQTIALIPDLTLLFVPFPELAVTVSVPAAEQASFVTLVAYRLISVLFLDSLPLGHDENSRVNSGTLIILNPPNEAFGNAIVDEAVRLGCKGLRFVFMTTTDTISNHQLQSGTGHWCTVHPMASDSALRSLLPRDTVALLDARPPNPGKADDRSAASMRRLLPSQSHYRSVQSILSFATAQVSQVGLSQYNLSNIGSTLKTCVNSSLPYFSKAQLADGTGPVYQHNIRPNLLYLDQSSQLSRQGEQQLLGTDDGNQDRLSLDTVVAWSARPLSQTTTPSSGPSNALCFTVQPAHSLVKFSGSKTYWLAGLSGGLGLLLCEWMISHGARHFVLSSRRAGDTVSQVWVNKMSVAYGATINVVSCDLADRAALRDLYYQRIKPTMPPIAGVCQGAMVLDDVSIGDMSLENLLKVTKPKVQGSLNLDELFPAHGPDEQLDFFVFFSSVGSITGQPGQANYAAANMFMTALAEKRRRRGQVASVMHIGPILGAGYITRQGLDSALTLNNSTKSIMQGWFPITERDFFQHFAEAVLAGRRVPATQRKAGSASGYHPSLGMSTGFVESIGGLAQLSASDGVGTFLRHCAKRPDPEYSMGGASTTGLKGQASVPIKTRLLEARTQPEVVDIIRDALLIKLSVLFQAELDKLQGADSSSLSLSQMGVDSLMAVELRSWFVKSMQVNIPVLKILSGVSVAELVQIAADTIPQVLVPLADQPGQAGPEEQVRQPPANTESPVQEDALGGYHASRYGPVVEDGKPNNGNEALPSSVDSWPGLDTSPDSTESDTDQENVKGQSVGSNNDFTPFKGLYSACSSPEPDHLLESRRPQLEKTIPLSYSQSLFWFSTAFSIHDPASLNMTGGFRLTGGPLRVDKLKEAVLATGQQHESLRTCFFVDPTDGQPRQGIMKSTALHLEHIDSSTDTSRSAVRGSKLEQETGLDTLLLYHLDQVHNHAYDLDRGQTIRLVLISHPSKLTDNYFIIGTHHLAMDGASFQPLMADILKNYNRLCGEYPGQDFNINLDCALTQYPDSSQKQRDNFEAGDMDAELSFWREELLGKYGLCPPLPVLRNESFITERPALQGNGDTKPQGNRYVHIEIGPAIKAQVQALCRRRRAATPFHFYLAVFRVLLWRFSGGHESFAIGIGDANRTEEEMMSCIGNFVNLLPIVFSSTSNTHEAENSSGVEDDRGPLALTTFTSLLDGVSSKAHRALANSKVPFQLLLDELRIPRSATTTPIFQAFADYRLARGQKTRWGARHELELLTLRLSKLNYDVAIDILDNNSHGETTNDDRCSITFILRGDLYSQDDTQRLANSYTMLAGAFAAKPGLLIGKADIFTQAEMDESLVMGQGPLYQPPEAGQWGSTFLHRLYEMARQFPERAAVISERQGMENVAPSTYHNIVRKRVDRIIGQLQTAGASVGSRVAVLQEPAPDWVSSILAVMKMGAVYVPLDPTQPLARLAAMVEDCQPQVLLGDSQTVELAQKILSLEQGKTKLIKVITVAIESQNKADEETSPSVMSPILATPEATAAILYTSGSTGTPKGIVIAHGGINSWLEPCDSLYNLTTSSPLVTLQQSAPGFDMSLMQILTALCFGGAVYLLPRKLRGDASAISSAIVRHGVTLTFSTPSEVSSWIRHAPDNGTLLRSSSWKTALVGGEMLSRAVLDEFARLEKPNLRFHHMYGTTEATFCAAVLELDYRYLCKFNRDGRGNGTSSTENNYAEARQEHHYPAGVPLPNYKIYILDECQRPLPPGLQGEVYIAGAGVRRESQYLNNPALSHRTFLNDPFASNEERTRGGGYMQRTGDLGRWQVNGNSEDANHGAICHDERAPNSKARGVLIIEGRVEGDTMVKLRGLRVDLREVEVALLRAGAAASSASGHDSETSLVNLKDAVVSVRRRDFNSPEFLVAHVLGFTGKSSKPCQNLPPSFVRGLRHQLGLLGLAPNLHPAFIVAVEKLPMTSSGKLDRKAVALLPLADNSDSQASRNDSGSSDTWTTTEARLKAIWEDLLFARLNHTSSNTTQELEMPPITPETDFFHIGGTSLSLLTLRQRIKQEFVGVQIPIVDLFESSTLSDMARRVERDPQADETGKKATRATHRPIDWEEETRLRPTMLTADPVPINANTGLPRDGTNKGKVVILTGATGHLGSALVQSLTSDPTVAEVHCLAVRNPFTRSDIDHLRQNPKVKLYPGDLGQPQMGLWSLTPTPSAHDADELSASAQSTPKWICSLFSRADLIIHNGADTSYLKTYHSLKAANLTTTKDLIEWCLLTGLGHGTGRMIPFHFISTAGVGNLLFSSYPQDSRGKKETENGTIAAQEILQPSSLGMLIPPTDGSMGYTCSKWASEKFLERLVERFPSWEVYIHRPTVISRGKDLIVPDEGQTARQEDVVQPNGGKSRSAVPDFDGVHNIFWYARHMNAVPISSGIARGVLNVVRLEDVVEGILATALVGNSRNSEGEGTEGDGGLRFVNHAGELNLGLDEMRTWAAVRGREKDGYLYVESHGTPFLTQEADDEDGNADASLTERFQEIPLDDWVQRACELGMHPALAELLLSFARNGEVVFPTVVTK